MNWRKSRPELDPSDLIVEVEKKVFEPVYARDSSRMLVEAVTSRYAPEAMAERGVVDHLTTNGSVKFNIDDYPDLSDGKGYV